jgi:ribosomal protein S12 methylthiotransferase
MYAFPAGFPTDILRQIHENPKVCRYLDMPVQHVADPVLASMRRGITSAQLRSLVAQIRSSVPGIALRTTLIVGYPGEGEREFEELLSFVKETEFDRLGVFLYSQEDGTGAYGLGDPVPRPVKEERQAAIMQAQAEISLRKNRAKIGTTVDVLIDAMEGGVAIGRTEHDAPEVDNEVTIHAAEGLSVGQMCPVTIVDAEEYDLFGVPATPPGA